MVFSLKRLDPSQDRIDDVGTEREAAKAELQAEPNLAD